MKGLELSERFYRSVSQELESCFPDAVLRMAAGLVGEGSECFGFDDEYSRDHDWGPRFVIWLTEKDFLQYGEALGKWYDSLPKDFSGFRKVQESGEGRTREGVMRIGSFYRRYTGLEDVPETLMDWMALPESYLAVVTNGKVFCDPVGEFTRIREAFLGFYPEDVRLKKMAARAAAMAQSGQYNYPRCIRRGELVASALALHEFLQAGISMVYLLNRKYMPFYKWAHRGMKDLQILPEMFSLFSQLAGKEDAGVKTDMIENISVRILDEMVRQGICSPGDPFLISHAGEIMDRIGNAKIRSLHMMVG